MAGKKMPAVYCHPGSYARENGEMDLFRASRQANIACKEAIETAIESGWNGVQTVGGSANDVLRAFGAERVSYVLAATVQSKKWDERISSSNHQWADRVPIFDPPDRRYAYLVSSHSCKLDSLIDVARQEMAQERKPSVRKQLAAKPVSAETRTAKAAKREER